MIFGDFQWEMNKNSKEVGKFLSFILRHKPEKIGLTLDSEGWADIATLIACAAKSGHALSREVIQVVVDTNDKKRFTISEDGSRIRAAQGHSTASVTIQYQEQKPPEFLYHGTATRFLDSIKEKGLLPGSRHHVHLSADEQTAVAVGQRHGKPVVLKINALLMYEQGVKFYLAENGVWLTNQVSSDFLIFD